MPESAAPARAPVPTGKLVRPSLTACLLQKVPPHFFFSTVPPERCPSVGPRIAQPPCSLIYSRISSNSQSLVGPCPTGDGLPPPNPAPGSAAAIPDSPGPAEE